MPTTAGAPDRLATVVLVTAPLVPAPDTPGLVVETPACIAIVDRLATGFDRAARLLCEGAALLPQPLTATSTLLAIAAPRRRRRARAGPGASAQLGVAQLH